MDNPIGLDTSLRSYSVGARRPPSSMPPNFYMRPLDLYLSGDIPKEMLTERKTRLETTIAALEKE